MRTIVCYGDSNTHGAAADLTRFERDVRWPGVAQRELAGWAHLIEEGLNGRTTIWDDPHAEGRNGRTYLLPCLRSHAPIDLVVIMLGTNDLKRFFGRTAAEIAAGAGVLVDLARTSATGPDGAAPAVLLVAPPPLGELTAYSEIWGFEDARAKAAEFPRLYATVAAMKGAFFLDAGTVVAPDPADGVHLTADGHAALGRAIAARVREILV
jgi:lysophospholipase L1-like esterase